MKYFRLRNKRSNAFFVTVFTTTIAFSVSNNLLRLGDYFLDDRHVTVSFEQQIVHAIVLPPTESDFSTLNSEPRAAAETAISFSSDRGVTATRSTVFSDRTTNQTVSLSSSPLGASYNNRSNYSYAYVIGGVDPAENTYVGFIYNILVSVRILRQQGAQADVVMFVQIAFKSLAETLAVEDIRLLSALGVEIRYLPKSQVESFYDTVLNKFQILDMTEYRRVLLMDGDLMPMSNLDYLFHLSDGPNAVLKPNVAVNGRYEPMNAGFFMLAPGLGELDRILGIIQKREEDARHLRGHKFDDLTGWGHVIEPPDKWVARRTQGTNWTFHFAYSDQGLLYYWTKYYKKSVSIIMEYGRVENWGTNGTNGTVQLEQVLDKPFANYSKPLMYVFNQCKKFLCDFEHFSGKGKPWWREPPADLSDATRTKSAEHLWYHTLGQLNEELNMGLNFSDWKLAGVRPPFGLWANKGEMDRRVFKRMSSTGS